MKSDMGGAAAVARDAARRRRPAPADPGHRARGRRREHAERHRAAPRRRAARSTAAAPSRCSTPTPRAASCSPTRSRTPTPTSQPDVIVDVATLTGAMPVALGKRTPGCSPATTRSPRSSRRPPPASGEPLWRMPLVDDYRRALDSPVADLRNIGQPKLKLRAARSPPRCSCASSPAAGRGPTSTSPGRSGRQRRGRAHQGRHRLRRAPARAAGSRSCRRAVGAAGGLNGQASGASTLTPTSRPCRPGAGRHQARLVAHDLGQLAQGQRVRVARRRLGDLAAARARRRTRRSRRGAAGAGRRRGSRGSRSGCASQKHQVVRAVGQPRQHVERAAADEPGPAARDVPPPAARPWPGAGARARRRRW